jgi:hypothetical protein
MTMTKGMARTGRMAVGLVTSASRATGVSKRGKKRTYTKMQSVKLTAEQKKPQRGSVTYNT